MSTTTETNERREEGEGVVVKTAHDVVALAHCVAALLVSKKNRDVQNNNNTFCEEIEKKAFQFFLKDKNVYEERDANGLTPMNVYCVLGMCGNERFERLFEHLFLRPIEEVVVAGKSSSKEEKLSVQIEKFKRNLFCRHVEDVDDPEKMVLMQVHACTMNDLACLKRIIHLENVMILRVAKNTDREECMSSLRFTPRLLAAALRHPHDESFQLVKFMLENYVKFDGTGLSEPLDDHGRNALHICARYDSPKTMKLVIEYLSSREGYAHKLNDIINCRDGFSQNHDGNRTPLMTACSFSPSCALLLIEKYGANSSSIRSKCGWTALFYAIEQQFRDFDIDGDKDIAEQTRVIRSLMEKRDIFLRQNPSTGMAKSDPGVEENATRKTILHLAAINSRSTQTLKILFESKSLVQTFLSQPDANGKTPLHDAAFRGCMDQALFLLHAIEKEKKENPGRRKEEADTTGKLRAADVNVNDENALAEQIQSAFGKSKYAGILSSPKLFRAFPSDDFMVETRNVRTLAENTLEYYEDKLFFDTQN